MRPLRLLSLTAALALLPLSAVMAEEPGAAEARLEAASEAFEARMEEFGERAEAIGDDETLSDSERTTRIAALWAEYAGDVTTFTTVASEASSAIAAEALADIDVEAVVAEAMADAEMQASLAQGGAAANGLTRNWAENPEMLNGLVRAALVEAQAGLDAAGVEQTVFVPEAAGVDGATDSDANLTPPPAYD